MGSCTLSEGCGMTQAEAEEDAALYPSNITSVHYLTQRICDVCFVWGHFEGIHNNIGAFT